MRFPWKKFLLYFLIFLLLVSMVFIPMMEIAYGKEEGETIKITAKEDDKERDCSRKMNLPPNTQKRLRGIYWRIYKDYADMIETYTKAGALTWKQRETRLKMLKNYIDTFYRRNYRWCSEHEPDEWEEEWYNIDEND